jgi:signal transduction histidine kinase
MRLGIKSKQVLGVTSIVGAVVVLLSLLYLAGLARVNLEESRARAEFIADAVYHRAREVVAAGAGDPYRALSADPGLRSILDSSLYSKNVTFAAIVDVRGIAIADTDPALEGQLLPAGGDLEALATRTPLFQLLAIYGGQGQNVEFSEPLRMGDTDFGAIRIGVSTLLIRQDLATSLRPAIVTAGVALALSVLVAMLFAQLLLRPIHVISGGLTRLGRGEMGVRVDLDQDDEFGELGTSFNAVSARLSEDQSRMAGRKLAALSRLSAGVAHEVKNPLNAMMIHLELLRQHVDSDAGRSHADVIGNEIRRLDEVVQGFLKFSRPEDLKLQAVRLAALLDEVVPIVRPEADRMGVRLVVESSVDVPDVNGDPTMLRQAFLNLALNACQAMPGGGTLRIHAEAARGRRVSIAFIDSGVGIKPEHLERIFDLYFTTKENGSGIGLSMVYRTVQMHDGEIEVQSIPGAGATFTILLPQA